MQGKILTNASAIDRSKTDFYPTPPEATIALLEYLGLHHKRVWECACGKGDISKVLMAYGCDVRSTDLYDDSYGEVGIDFLTAEMIGNPDWIITNPPFKHAEAFIRKASEHGKPFALLLKSQYWHASRRTKLFREYKPSKVLALNWRPDFHFGAKGGSPTMECIWVVWGTGEKETIYDILERPKQGGLTSAISNYTTKTV